MDPWKRSALSASPFGSEDEYDSEDHDLTTRDADLYRELDLSTREDTAIIKNDPFSKAKRKPPPAPSVVVGRVQAPPKPKDTIRPDIEEAKAAGWEVKNGPPPKNTVKAFQPLKTVKSRASSSSTTQTAPKPRMSKKDWQNHSGWFGAGGNPLPAAPPPKENFLSKLESLGTAEYEAKGKKKAAVVKKATARKGKKKSEDDKITFGMIPAGAAPTDEFPIVKSLEKQKKLPAKRKTSKKKTIIRSPSPSPAPDIKLIDAIVNGLPEKKDAQEHPPSPLSKSDSPTQRLSSKAVSADDQDKQEDQGPVRSKYFSQEDPKEITTFKLPEPRSSTATVVIPATPPTSNAATLVQQLQDLPNNIEPIKTLGTTENSSSTLGYSSPLGNKSGLQKRPASTSNVHRPTAHRHNPIALLERMVDPIPASVAQAQQALNAEEDRFPEDVEMEDMASTRTRLQEAPLQDEYPVLRMNGLQPFYPSGASQRTRSRSPAQRQVSVHVDQANHLRRFVPESRYGPGFRRSPSPYNTNSQGGERRHFAGSRIAIPKTSSRREPLPTPSTTEPVWSTLTTKQNRYQPKATAKPLLGKPFMIPLPLTRQVPPPSHTSKMTTRIKPRATLFTPSSSRLQDRANDIVVRPAVVMKSLSGIKSFGAAVDARAKPYQPSHISGELERRELPVFRISQPSFLKHNNGQVDHTQDFENDHRDSSSSGYPPTPTPKLNAVDDSWKRAWASSTPVAEERIPALDKFKFNGAKGGGSGTQGGRGLAFDF